MLTLLWIKVDGILSVNMLISWPHDITDNQRDKKLYEMQDLNLKPNSRQNSYPLPLVIASVSVMKVVDV